MEGIPTEVYNMSQATLGILHLAGAERFVALALRTKRNESCQQPMAPSFRLTGVYGDVSGFLAVRCADCAPPRLLADFAVRRATNPPDGFRGRLYGCSLLSGRLLITSAELHASKPRTSDHVPYRSGPIRQLPGHQST